MKRLIYIEPIAVKDKNEVVKALTILEKIGINVMSDDQKEKYLANEERKVENNFMIQEEDGGFRIQSHYIGFGISIESLDQQVKKILEKIPDIKERINEIENKRNELQIEIQKKREKFEEEANKIASKTQELENSYGIIEIKEKL